ncbi:MAG: mechanosensitive ion channel family protein [Candidatus Krumholzibacteriia bacterium]
MDTILKYLDLDAVIRDAVAFAPRLVVAILVMAAFWLLYRLSRRPLRATLGHTGLHEKLVDLLVDSIYRYTLVVFGLVMALGQLGVNVGAAVAGLGVAGIAVGLAAQDALSNTIAGFTIFWDKPFVVGDWLSVAGEYGMVQDITLRSTRIRTPRNSYVVIPNKHIIDEVLENDSTHGDLRIDVPIGIAYKEDTEAARTVLLAAAASVDGVLANPAPTVVVAACADSSVNLLVRVWMADAAHRQRVQFATLEAAKRALDTAGIQIPFPHLQLFWDDVRPQVVERLRTLADRAG